MAFKIEKGIPLPTKSKWRKLANDMKFDDSILLSKSGASCLFREIQKCGGANAITSKISEDQIRLWKVKRDVSQQEWKVKRNGN